MSREKRYQPKKSNTPFLAKILYYIVGFNFFFIFQNHSGITGLVETINWWLPIGVCAVFIDLKFKGTVQESRNLQAREVYLVF